MALDTYGVGGVVAVLIAMALKDMLINAVATVAHIPLHHSSLPAARCPDLWEEKAPHNAKLQFFQAGLGKKVGFIW